MKAKKKSYLVKHSSAGYDLDIGPQKQCPLPQHQRVGIRNDL